MSFRVPVLETYLWQPQVRAIINNPTEVTFAKGDRFIVGPTPAAGSVFEGHANAIAWYDGTAWKFDLPNQGWTTIVTAFESEPFKLVVFDGTTWDLYESRHIAVDGSEFSVQIPQFDSGSDVPVGTKWTLHRLLVWMDSNFGGPGPLGTPSDGTYVDGLFEWTKSTRINDALDDANEALRDLAPAQADSLAGKRLTLNVTPVTSAKLAANIPNGDTNWYVDGMVAGSQLDNLVITTSTVKLSTPDTATCFGRGDEGLLKINHTVGNSSDVTESVYDISSNYVEPLPGNTRFATQDLNLWTKVGNCQANGSPAQPTAFNNTSVLKFNSDNSNITILSVGKYNNFNLWQKMNAEVNYKALTPGFHSLVLDHVVRSVDRKSKVSKFFYDPNATDVIAISNGQLVPVTNDSTVYISGIKYYTKGTNVRVEFKATNLFKYVYSPTTIADVTVSGDSKYSYTPGGTGVNVAAIPNYDDDLVVSHVIALASNATSANLNATVNTYHPFKTGATTVISSATPMLYTGYGSPTQSNNFVEAFKDEAYRLPSTFDFNTIPASLISQWDSTKDLTSTNDAVLYLNNLQANAPDMSGILPAGNPNYSAKAIGQTYYRAFKSSNIAQSSVTLTMLGTGVNPLTNLVPVGNTTGWNLEIKLPGVTGWLDAGAGYDSATFIKTKDGCGCQNQGATTSTMLAITFGGANISASGYTMFMRLTLNSASTKFQRITTNWS